MPKMEKSPPELVERFDTVAAEFPEATRRLTFGYPCLYVGGNMVSGLFGNDWWVRVSEPDRERLLELPGAHPLEVMPGKAMGRSVVLPAEVVASDADLDGWLVRAIAFTRTLPPKKK